MSSERLIRELIDPDFGPLGLWEDRSMGGPIGGPVRELVILTWRGEVAGITLYLAAADESDDAVTQFSEGARALVRRIAASGDELVVQAASQMLEVARDWSDNPDLTVEAVAHGLRLDAIDVHPNAQCPLIAIWLEDTADIFHGHALLANLDEHGRINDVGLEG